MTALVWDQILHLLWAALGAFLLARSAFLPRAAPPLSRRPTHYLLFDLPRDGGHPDLGCRALLGAVGLARLAQRLSVVPGVLVSRFSSSPVTLSSSRSTRLPWGSGPRRPLLTARGRKLPSLKARSAPCRGGGRGAGARRGSVAADA